MKKMFMSVLFVTGLILPAVSFSDGGGSLMGVMYASCNVSEVSQYPDKLVVEVSHCVGIEKIALLYINIENPMMSSISSMAQNALVSGKKIKFSLSRCCLRNEERNNGFPSLSTNTSLTRKVP